MSEGMMRNEDYNEILARIKHIKSLFAFGEGILPFLEELFLFLREVAPLLNEVSESLMNTTGLMPEATTELDAAVDETSDAAFRIMDSVEHINRLIEQLGQTENLSDEGLMKLEDMKSSAHSIMTALQFHDIVSQKLIHVRKVLSEVQRKMLQLFTRVYELDIDDDIKANILQTFGVNLGQFKRMMETKVETPEYMTAQKSKKHREAEAMPKFDQNDIDSLFG
jgi:methyl-accepting chemotaxis protein